ncbi:MAG TPA: prepilin-type N-terminal cleavage/methylation domain-containing protein [Actinoplanes sp.]|jgi:type IV pilus assembly protein PilA|nr:prepilin-type N-terminal cleavage/methylation domain-containing protein [Actinoplanes sp.]
MHDTINRLRAKKGDEGFTLIELLVVVVIIGVLVAIAVPVYLNYRKGAADKSAQSDVRGAVSTVEQYYTDNNNEFPGDVAATTGTGGKVTMTKQTNGNDGVVTLSSGTEFQFENNDATYVICATNADGSGKIYVYNSDGGGSVKPSTQSSLADCISNGN